MEKKMADGRKCATGFTRGGKFNRARAASIALIAVLSFVVSVSVLSCDNGDNGFTDNHKLNSTLQGKFSYTGDYGTDGYNIVNNTVGYFDDYGSDWNSNIAYVTNYSDTTGVIIVQYTSGNDYGTPVTVGNFTGVYFAINSKDVVQFATAYHDNTSGEVIPYEFDNLDDAKAAFNPISSLGTYVGEWGTYTRQ